MKKGALMGDDVKAQAMKDLDVARFFDLTSREVFFYRLLCFLFHRGELKFAQRVAAEMNFGDAAPLGDFERGRLLGILDGLFWSKSISEHMHTMLQIAIQGREG